MSKPVSAEKGSAQVAGVGNNTGQSMTAKIDGEQVRRRVRLAAAARSR
jgi:hypothetical protein